MNSSLPTLAVIVGAYLVGSISFAVVMSRLFGLPDPRSYGSGNPGATNVLRSGNKTAAALTLAGDGFKGWFAVWLAPRLGASWGDASLAAAVAAPPLALYFIGNRPESWALFPIALLLVWRHRGNIRKIRSGQERR